MGYPEERHETPRQAILRYLNRDRASAADLSKLIQQPEKTIYQHLQALMDAGKVRTRPAACGQCGFSFERRSRAGKPGKCPRCQSTRILPPLFETTRSGKKASQKV